MPMPETPEQVKPVPKMVILVRGGNIQALCCSKGFPDVDVVVIDHDNMEADGIGELPAVEIQDRAIADTPEYLGWADHTDYVED